MARLGKEGMDQRGCIYSQEEFPTQGALCRSLGRDKSRDVTLDYLGKAQDDYAQLRGIDVPPVQQPETDKVITHPLSTERRFGEFSDKVFDNQLGQQPHRDPIDYRRISQQTTNNNSVGACIAVSRARQRI